jgi:hypothetical protein
MKIDLRNISAEQEQIILDIIKTCKYLRDAREYNIGDDVIVNQARELGFMYQKLEKVSQ